MPISVKKIANDVWKFTGKDSVNFYLIDLGHEKMLIDTGDRSDQHEIKTFLGNLAGLDRINKVIFTHLHYDHCGNFDLFPNADFYASEQEIADFNNDRETAIFSKEIAAKFNITLKPLPEKLSCLEIISTPGHTRGSVCVLYREKKILFTGDTLFGKRKLGRTDLPNSAPGELGKSIVKLLDYGHNTLAPGHDY